MEPPGGLQTGRRVSKAAGVLSAATTQPRIRERHALGAQQQREELLAGPQLLRLHHRRRRQLHVLPVVCRRAGTTGGARGRAGERGSCSPGRGIPRLGSRWRSRTQCTRPITWHSTGIQLRQAAHTHRRTRHVGRHLRDLGPREEAVLARQQEGGGQKVLRQAVVRGMGGCGQPARCGAVSRPSRVAACLKSPGRRPPPGVAPPLQLWCATPCPAARGPQLPAPTCVAAIRISPDFGVHRLFITPIRWYASARASSVCSVQCEASAGFGWVPG